MYAGDHRQYKELCYQAERKGGEHRVIDGFGKTVDYTVIAVLAVCMVVELFVLPVITGVHTTEDIIFAIIALIVIVMIGYAVKVGAWFFGPRNP